MAFNDPRRLIIFVDGYTQNRDVVMKWMREHNFQAHTGSITSMRA